MSFIVELWAFLRAHPGLRTDGHNVFVYHPPASRDAPMDVDFDGKGEVLRITAGQTVSRHVRLRPMR